MKPKSNWWNHFFDIHFASLQLERSDLSKLEQESAFLIDELQLKKDQLVFDQCCGTGELSRMIAKNSIKTIGIDQCATYIEIAREKVKKHDLACEFHQFDALDFICQPKANAAFNWYTSFGYSDDDRINTKMIANSYQSLKPGARFVLDYTNPAFVFQNFTEHQQLKKPLEQGMLTAEKRSGVDLERGMFTSSWTYFLPDGSTLIKSGESRIYWASDLKKILQSCGYKILSIKGDIFGSTLTKDSHRCIITAQK